MGKYILFIILLINPICAQTFSSFGNKDLSSFGTGDLNISKNVSFYYGHETYGKSYMRGALSSFINSNREIGFATKDMEIVKNLKITYGFSSSQEGYINYYKKESNIFTLDNKSDQTLTFSPTNDINYVNWHDITYGDPGKSGVWFRDAQIKMDKNYKSVASSGAKSGIDSFLSTPGLGDNSPQWWKPSGDFSKNWIRGNAPISGSEIHEQSFGINVSNFAKLSRNTLTQTDMDTGDSSKEVNDKAQINLDRTGTSLNINNTKLIENKNGAESNVASHTSLEFNQKIPNQDNANISIKKDSWEQDSSKPTMIPYDNKTSISISNLNIASGNISYENTDTDYVGDAPKERIQNFSINSIKLSKISASANLYSRKVDGVEQNAMTNILVNKYEIFRGFNLNSYRYIKKYLYQQEDSVSHDIDLGGNLGGIDWSYKYILNNTNLYDNSVLLYNNSNINKFSSLLVSKKINNIDFILGNTNINSRDTYDNLTYLASRGVWSIKNNEVGVNFSQYIKTNNDATYPSNVLNIYIKKDKVYNIGFRNFYYNNSNFLSRTIWADVQYDKLNLSTRYRKNPFVKSGENQAPIVWVGDTYEAKLGYVGTHISGNVYFSKNGIPVNSIYAPDWPSIESIGPMSDASNRNMNSIDIDKKMGADISYISNNNILSLSYNQTHYLSIPAYHSDVSLNAKIMLSNGNSFSCIYKKWWPSYEIDSSSNLIDGESYTVKYSQQWDDGFFNIGITDLGPLDIYWNDPAYNAEIQKMVGTVPEKFKDYSRNLKLFMEFSTKF